MLSAAVIRLAASAFGRTVAEISLLIAWLSFAFAAASAGCAEPLSICEATAPMPASVCIRRLQHLVAAGQGADFFFYKGELAFQGCKMAFKA